MEPCFKFDLREQVAPRLVTAGRFDGEHPCLVCATKTGKIVVHDPYRQQASGTAIRHLTFQKQITALAAGASAEGSPKDVLFVGSQTDLLAYDVDRNAEVFQREIPDGVFAIRHGAFGAAGQGVVFAGGNCSIIGVDASGRDAFWTVLGDNVCAMALCDLTGQGHNQLVVGAEDQEMRVYVDGGELLHEFSETEAVVDLASLGGGRFAYALANGTVGTYNGPDKAWRVKMASTPVCVAAFDMTMDGSAELIVGWSDGTVEVRTNREGGGGEVIARDKLGAAVAGVAVADYRMDGTNVLLVVSAAGEVRGYLPIGVSPAAATPLFSGSSPEPREPSKRRTSALQPGAGADADLAALADKTRKLEKRRRELLAKLTRSASTGPTVPLRDPLLSVSLEAVEGEGDDGGGGGGSAAHVRLTLSLGVSDAAIAMVVMTSDGLFEDDVAVAYQDPASPTASVSIAVAPPKNVPHTIQARVVFGPPDAAAMQVHAVEVAVPALALFAPCAAAAATTTAAAAEDPDADGVRLPLGGAAYKRSQIDEWLSANTLPPHPSLAADGTVAMRSLRDGAVVTVALRDREVAVLTASMDVAADVVQSMLRHVGVSDLNSAASFPASVAAFREVLARINGLQSVRRKLSAEIADKSNLAKGLLFQAEDSRILRDHASMKAAYRSLFTLNQDLVAQYNIRCTNHAELLDALKAVNHFIQSASRLRAGKHTAAVVTACREALQANDVERIVRVVCNGVPL